MRVGVDGRSLARGARRGVARVTFELLAAMSERFPQDEWRILLAGGEGEVPSGAIPHRVRIPGKVLFGISALARRPRIDALLGGVDVMWLPAPAPVAISRDVPWVLTLHDLSWIERPGDFTRYERAWHLLARGRAQAQRAARVAATSEYTRRTAVERFDLDPAKVVVIPPPVGTSSATSLPRLAGGDPYFLWVGALEPRKAPDVLEAAWNEARVRGLAARLVVVGEGRVSLDGPDVQQLGRVTDGELAALYEGAIGLVMPSWLEGAGLPPLEAALHGTPSICSDLAVLRESLGPDGAEWVTPGDIHELATALLKLAGDASRTARIASAAKQKAAARVDPGPPAQTVRELLAQAACASD